MDDGSRRIYWKLFSKINVNCPDILIVEEKSNYQLISRILFQHYHLSGPFITKRILLPTLQHRASNPQTLVYVALQHARFTHIGYY